MVSNRELSITFTSNGKTRICTTWPSFLLTFRLLFINSTPKLVVLYNFLSLRIVLSCFYLLIFCFEKFSSWIWRLPYTWSSLLQPVQTSLIIQRLNKKKHLRERTTSMVSQSLLSKKKKRNPGYKNCVNSNFQRYSYLTQGITIKVVSAHSLSLKFINIV